MRLFLSYRRDDTAGRAGRLFDGLTQRLGRGHVFQDVEAISPGVDFERAVDDSLSAADVAVVVIGPAWASVTGSDDRPRLADADDFVRREVAVALRSERPVVPVLVGGASLPAADALPEELHGLLKRQTFTVRDDAWNDDVDDLVRHLRAQIGGGSRRRAVGAGVAVAVAAGAVVAAIVLWPDGDGGDGDASSVTSATTAPSGIEPPCTVVDERSLTALEPAEAAPAELTTSDGRVVGFRAVGVAVQERDEVWRVISDIEVTNLTTAGATEPGMENWYAAATDFRGITAGGALSEPTPDCFNVVSGARNLAPGATVVVQVGFDTPDDPNGAELVLTTAGPAIPLAGGT